MRVTRARCRLGVSFFFGSRRRFRRRPDNSIPEMEGYGITEKAYEAFDPPSGTTSMVKMSTRLSINGENVNARSLIHSLKKKKRSGASHARFGGDGWAFARLSVWLGRLCSLPLRPRPQLHLAVRGRSATQAPCTRQKQCNTTQQQRKQRADTRDHKHVYNVVVCVTAPKEASRRCRRTSFFSSFFNALHRATCATCGAWGSAWGLACAACGMERGKSTPQGRRAVPVARAALCATPRGAHR